MKKFFLLFLSISLILTTAFSSIPIIRAITDEVANVLEETTLVSDSAILEETTIKDTNSLQLLDNTKLSLWSSMYKPSDEQKKEIVTLIKNGADIDILIKICEFWEDTDAPFSIISQIYAKAPEAEALEQIYDHMVWIESAYNEITGNDNNLSVEEVKEYISLGVTLEDLYVANRAARNSTVNPKVVLDRRVAGDNWIEVIAPHIENDFSDEEKETISGHDVLDSLIIERKTGAEPTKTLKTALESRKSAMGIYSASLTKELDVTTDDVISEGGTNDEEQ